MTYWDVYIGGLDDPDFSWGSEAQEGEPPKRLSPFFPSTGRSGPTGARGFPREYPGGVFGELVGAIEEGRFEGRKVDWGAWVAAVTKEEIEAFVEERYGKREDDALRELRAYVASLRAGGRYALVAAES